MASIYVYFLHVVKAVVPIALTMHDLVVAMASYNVEKRATNTFDVVLAASCSIGNEEVAKVPTKIG